MSDALSAELSVADVLAPVPSMARMIGRALLLRCPRCGVGDQFRHWVRRRDHCPGCGYSMEHRPDFFFGAYILNLILTLVALFLLLLSVVVCEAAQVDPPFVPIIAIGLVIALGLPVGAYPFTFTLWAVVDLRTEPLELREIADALDNLDADRSAEAVPVGTAHH